MALDSNLLGPFDTESTSSGSPSEDTVNPTPSKQNRRTYAHCLALIRNGALLIFNGKLKLVDKQQMTAKSGLLAEKFLKTLKLESRRRLDISCAHSLLSPSWAPEDVGTWCSLDIDFVTVLSSPSRTPKDMGTKTTSVSTSLLPFPSHLLKRLETTKREGWRRSLSFFHLLRSVSPPSSPLRVDQAWGLAQARDHPRHCPPLSFFAAWRRQSVKARSAMPSVRTLPRSTALVRSTMLLMETSPKSTALDTLKSNLANSAMPSVRTSPRSTAPPSWDQLRRSH